MLVRFGFCKTGKSHTANGTVCQDSHLIKQLENGWTVAAVADGVGSAKNSAVGSRIAVETVVSICGQFMPYDNRTESIKEMLSMGYNQAYKMIIKEAERTGEPVNSYDTTLTTVIYDGHRIVFAHSGDGGIIGLNRYGDFVQITEPQKGDDGFSVMPLRAGRSSWVIDAYDEELASVMLMTDGVYEKLCNYLLRLSDDPKKCVYAPLASYFADPAGFGEDEKGNEAAKKAVEELLEAGDDYNADIFYGRLSAIYKTRIPDKYGEVIDKLRSGGLVTEFMNRIEDDKTLVCLINTGIAVENKDSGYYGEPDWQGLQEKWNRLAYPQLYADKDRKKPEGAAGTDEAGAKDGKKDGKSRRKLSGKRVRNALRLKT